MNINALHESRIFVHLEDIFFKDTSGLLDNIQINEKEVNQQHDVLTNQFLPIIHFFEKNGRVPDMDSDDFDEELLAIALVNIKQSPEKIAHLAPLDKHHLLEKSDEP